MAPMINARPGYVNYALNEPVAASQTIRKGDLIKYVDGSSQVTKADVGDTKLLGFATHEITTGQTVTERDRLIVDPFHSQSLTRITLSNTAIADPATFDARTLVGKEAAFIDENNEIRVNPGSGPAVIVEVVERGIPTNDPVEVYINVKAANRVRDAV